MSLTLVTVATTHRSLYVGATRGRDENRLLVVTDEPDAARDVLEQVVVNDRADLPAVAQRRALAEQVKAPDGSAGEARLERAHAVLRAARQDAAAPVAGLREAESLAGAAASSVEAGRAAMRRAAPWRRPALARALRTADDELGAARAAIDRAATEAAPYTANIVAAGVEVREAERRIAAQRLRERLCRLEVKPPARGRSVGIPPLGR